MDILDLAIKKNKDIFYKLFDLGENLYKDLMVETINNKMIIEFDHLEESLGEVYLYFKEINKKEVSKLNIQVITDIYLYEKGNENDFGLGDMVEIINVDGLNRVLYNEYPKGGKELIGLQGKITMIDNMSCKNVIYYLVNLPNANRYRYIDSNCIVDGRIIFLEENLKLISKGGNYKMSKKEQLLNELEQIKKEFKEKIEKVQKKIKEEDNKNKWWTPTYCDKFYTITETSINQYDWNDDAFDNKCINKLNVYQTKEQAERQAFEELLHKKLKKFAFENNEEEIDWKSRANKYSIIYNNFNNELAIEIYMSFYNFGAISFSSKEVAEKAIKEFRDDLIRYFTSDK